jgi:hypothetical protein
LNFTPEEENVLLQYIVHHSHIREITRQEVDREFELKFKKNFHCCGRTTCCNCYNSQQPICVNCNFWHILRTGERNGFISESDVHVALTACVLCWAAIHIALGK